MILAISIPPTAPAKPPRPTTEPTAWRGNMSDVSVKRFADQPWWAEAARLDERRPRPTESVAFDANTIGSDGQRAHQHRRLAARIDAPAALEQRRRQPAAADAADVGDEIDRDERRPDRAEVDAVVAVEKIRNPEEVEPPDRVGQELAERERPGLPVLQQPDPRDVRRRVGRIAADVRQLGSADRRVVLRRAGRAESRRTAR